MNFYEKEYREMFAKSALLEDAFICGKTMLKKLDDSVVVKLEISREMCASIFTGIRVTIINNAHGVIDTLLIRFSDVLGLYHNPNDRSKSFYHIMDSNDNQPCGEPKWVMPVTTAQKEQIAAVVTSYVEQFCLVEESRVFSEYQWKKLKSALFMVGRDGIDDFLGYECPYDENDTIDNLLENTYDTMTTGELYGFYRKYVVNC